MSVYGMDACINDMQKLNNVAIAPPGREPKKKRAHAKKAKPVIKKTFLLLITKLVKERQKKGESITEKKWIEDAIREKILREPTY